MKPTWSTKDLIEKLPHATSLIGMARLLGLSRATKKMIAELKALGPIAEHVFDEVLNRQSNFDKTFLSKLRLAVQESFTYRQVLIKLGVTPEGGNYKTIKDRIKKYQIDTSHFLKVGWNGGRQPDKSGKYTTRRAVKKKLQKIRGQNCEQCKNSVWNDKPILLELHHIDGNNQNNEDSNLQILCPNCHSQTPNFRNRKSK